MTESSVTAECRHCGESLSPQHTGPCPACGQTGKHVNVSVNEKIIISERISRTKTSRREQISKKPSSIIIAVILFLVEIIIGFLDQLLYFVIAIILSINGVACTPINEKKIIEREEHFSN